MFPHNSARCEILMANQWEDYLRGRAAGSELDRGTEKRLAQSHNIDEADLKAMFYKLRLSNVTGEDAPEPPPDTSTPPPTSSTPPPTLTASETAEDGGFLDLTSPMLGAATLLAFIVLRRPRSVFSCMRLDNVALLLSGLRY